MKFTLSWLKDHLETNATLQEISEHLTSIGLEVEDIEDRAEIYAPFKVVEVIEAVQHPNADKLRVCQVKTDAGIIQVVCGAPNARAGMKAVYAPEGSTIPHNQMILKKTKIRDVESNGMLVSMREMNLGENHEGIIDVDLNVQTGTPLSDLFGLNDPVIEINVTPNRADCAGVRGIARDLAAKGLGTLKQLSDAPLNTKGVSPISVNIESDSSCSEFIGVYIEGVSNKESPAWLQNRLKAIGLKPISALVDVTNYFAFDLCRPLHVFDADKIQGKNLNVRLAKTGENFKGLNEKEYSLQNFMTVISDDSGAISVGGVMGGLESGCSLETKNVFLEVAVFEPLNVAKTGRALQINSDARYRFERGIDKLFLKEAATRATAMIIDLCGGTAREFVHAGQANYRPPQISYSPKLAHKILGFEIPQTKQVEILEKLGCSVTQNSNEQWLITPPSWRCDLNIAHDIVEEITRIVGFDSIPLSEISPAQIGTQTETPRGQKAREVKQILASRGLSETVTWSFMDEKIAALFNGLHTYSNFAALKISNPIAADLNQMRPSLLPNLILAAQKNADKGLAPSPLFEVGPVFYGTESNEQPFMAAMLRYGAGEKHWSGAEAARAVDVFDIKADMLSALGANFANAPITREAPNYYHPGRSGAVRLGNKIIAYFGELHPKILEEMDVKLSPIVAAEIFIENILDVKKKGASKPALALSPFQPIQRDFAFVCKEELEAEQILKTIRGVDRVLITKTNLFDIYQGKGIEAGHKSIAVTVTLQPTTQSLNDAEIEATSAKIVKAVLDKTGAKLRV